MEGCEVKARVYLVRHGETAYNREMRVQGITDIPLNEVGREQAALLASRLRDEVSADVVASSNLIRAVETADCVFAAQQQQQLQTKRGTKGTVRRVVNADLHEIAFGTFDGHKVDEKTALGDEFRELWVKWDAGDVDASMPNGESPAQVLKRAWAALLGILNEAAADSTAVVDGNDHNGDGGVGEQKRRPANVVIVGHGRCLRILLGKMLGLPIKQIQYDNTAVCLLEWFGGDSFKAVFLNNTDHIKNADEATKAKLSLQTSVVELVSQTRKEQGH